MTDRRVLQTKAYADDANLAARQSIYAYLDPPVDLQRWAVALARWTGAERVVDVGCGNCRYVPALCERVPPERVVGVDLSVGMLRAIALAVRELRRVLRPDGVAIVVTNTGCRQALRGTPASRSSTATCAGGLMPAARSASRPRRAHSSVASDADCSTSTVQGHFTFLPMGPT